MPVTHGDVAPMSVSLPAMLDLFRPSYADARRTWLALAAARGLAVESHRHPLPGPQGEPLAIDVVRDGPADAEALLLTTSAVHGVEGHGGCGIQAGLLQVGESLRTLAGPRALPPAQPVAHVTAP